MPTAPDDPGLRPWLPRQRIEADRLDRWQSKTITDVVAGPGLLANRKGNSVTLQLASRPQPRGYGFFPVKIECENPTDTGDATSAASFVYTVRQQAWNGSGTSADYEYGTSVAPTRPRPTVGRMKAQAGDQGIGQAYYDENGGFHLYDAGEVMDFEPCET